PTPIHLGALPLSQAAGNRNVVAGFAAGLLVIISLVLAVACANVAGILIARGAARTREMALRMAIGADRRRLVRQVLSETSLLFVVGGAFGLALARLLTTFVVSVPSLPIPIGVS